MKTLAKTLLAAGVGLFGALSIGTAQAAPYTSGYGILPSGCYGDGNCAGGRCSTGNCSNGNCRDGHCSTNTWPSRYNDYGSTGYGYDSTGYGYGSIGRFDRGYGHDLGRDRRDWDRDDIGMSTRPFDSRYNSGFDRFDTRWNDDFGHDRFDGARRFETRPGYLNVSNPGYSTYNW